MDKKSKYTRPRAKQQQQQGTGPGDAKKNQDVVSGGKVFPKTSRRRESTAAGSGAGGGGYKNEQQSRKSASVQKAAGFDKRPKPKGQYHGGPKEDTEVAEAQDEAELGSALVPGSKKRNLNHLLNFHYAPRDALDQPSGGWNSARSRNWPTVQRHKYNKEQFLQANCQFVVNADGDYTAYLSDPDILVDWKLVEQIRIHSSENLSCPICLSPPIAGKMTRCGHVYCWPCILHYLALSDKAWRKCPICYESVHKSDLKSVIAITQNQLNIGDGVQLRLMRRERGSLIAMPVQESDDDGDSSSPPPTNFISLNQRNSTQIYSKLLLADIGDVQDMVDRERYQLEFQLEEDPQSPENCFIEQALTELSAREGQFLDKVCTANSSTKTSPESPTERKIGGGDDSETDNIESLGARGLSKFFYFYQAEDGQHLYLHAMNVKMLELQYGNLEHCPRMIWGKLIEKEVGSFTEDLRRRMRYLHHLPLTCQFEIAEIELAPPLITEEVIGYFAEQLENRERRRKRREREEQKREKKIRAEENKQMGKFPTRKVHIESRKHFPQWQPTDSSQSAAISVFSSSAESLATFSAASSPSSRGGSFAVEDNAPIIGDWHAANSVNSADQVGPSFAQMLRSNTGSRGGGSSSGLAWPSIGIADAAAPELEEAEDAEDAYAAAAPSYNQSFGDALAQALNQADLLDAGRNMDNSATMGKKKKKKNKQNKSTTTVLFATSMSRNS